MGVAGFSYALLSWQRVAVEEELLGLRPAWYAARLEPAVVVLMVILGLSVPGMVYEFAWLIGIVE